jgi:hypothetical protein
MVSSIRVKGHQSWGKSYRGASMGVRVWAIGGERKGPQYSTATPLPHAITQIYSSARTRTSNLVVNSHPPFCPISDQAPLLYGT